MHQSPEGFPCLGQASRRPPACPRVGRDVDVCRAGRLPRINCQGGPFLGSRCRKVSRGRPTPPASAMVCVGDHPWDMGPALRWPVGQAFEPPETPAVRRSHARHRCRSPDRMGGHRPKKLVCATGVAAAAVPGQGVHLARPSRRAGRAWPQRRLSCGLAVVHDENLSYKKDIRRQRARSPGRSAAVPTMDDLSCSH